MNDSTKADLEQLLDFVFLIGRLKLVYLGRLVDWVFLIGWVEGEDVPASCLECPNDFTLADGRCFSVKQQVLKRECQRITMSLVVQLYFAKITIFWIGMN